MILNVVIDGQSMRLKIEKETINEARDFFHKMDTDMDNGWQMSFTWVDNPNPVQRCQIAADKLYGAYEMENQKLMTLMGAYILFKLPGISEIHISTNGDMNETEVVISEPATR
ncbi:hypothetical protein MNBD_GAMMA25-1890 [hydrothermal vent metagenome]|uniref:Uncharacterized protein n=1 Tax=hydrothermal vent metagenome TaxID=652676 RepID=A0A3B1BP67_9ZZZZ